MTNSPDNKSLDLRPPRKVLIAVPTAAEWGARIVRGAMEYARTQGNRWELLFQASDTQDPRKMLSFGDPDAIILHPPVPKCIDIARALHKPVVLVGDVGHLADWPCVSEDNLAVGRLAMEHLASKGFMHFAYWGHAGAVYSETREKGYFEAALAAGMTIHPPRFSSYAKRPKPPADFEAWLARLPRPCALFLADCNLAAQAAWACRHLGIRVPEELAILGVNNDTLLCDITAPPLSSIEQNSRTVGYEAGAMVDDTLDGKTIEPRVRLVPPSGVVERQSTESLAISDPQVAEAMVFVRNFATEGITPRDVLEKVAASRTSLELRFKEFVGRTIFQEIMRVRMQQARTLLRETDWNIDTVAGRCGFSDATYFATAFRREHGRSPSAYRRDFH
jgi:LacI family transcriptional regulator